MRLESASHQSAPAYGAVLQVSKNGAKHSPLAVKSADLGVLRKSVITLSFY